MFAGTAWLQQCGGQLAGLAEELVEKVLCHRRAFFDSIIAVPESECDQFVIQVLLASAFSFIQDPQT